MSSNNIGNYYHTKRLFDVLNDGYSSKPLEMCDTLQESFKIVQDSCASFEEKLTEYKK